MNARPPLSDSQVFHLSLAHHVNLQALFDGTADLDILWQHTGGVLTWSHVAKRTRTCRAEMAHQIKLADTLLNRYRATGLVQLTPAEYQIARFGVGVMDLLASTVSQADAIAAAEWSEARLAEISALPPHPHQEHTSCPA